MIISTATLRNVRRQRGLRCLASSLLFLLGGCAVGPDFKVPDAVQDATYRPASMPLKTAATDAPLGTAQTFVANSDIPAQWWTMFHSQKLSELVDQALKANPSIPAAEATLRVAQENTAAQVGMFFPSLTATANPTRQKIATTLASPSSAGYTYYNLHTAQLNIGYVVDVFGGNRRQVESLQAQADYQFFQLQAVQLSLSANVINAALQIALLRAQIGATETSISIAAEQLPILHKQLLLGAIPEASVIAQEAIEAQARAMLPPLQKQLAQQNDLIAALTGRYPSQITEAAIDLADLTLPATLPLSLPSNIAAQRPDIRAAEEQLHAASAQIGVAIANLLPQLTLSAGIGSAALNVTELFKSGTGFWNLMGGLAQPLFDGGSLRHKKRSAEAAYEQAAQQYRSTVLSAFQNIADTLHALRYDAEVLATADAAERATFASLKIARRQVELGDTSYLSLLTAEQAYQQVRMNLLQAQANRFVDTAALFQALGGGWWNRTAAAGERNVGCLHGANCGL